MQGLGGWMELLLGLQAARAVVNLESDPSIANHLPSPKPHLGLLTLLPTQHHVIPTIPKQTALSTTLSRLAILDIIPQYHDLASSMDQFRGLLSGARGQLGGAQPGSVCRLRLALQCLLQATWPTIELLTD